MKASKWADEVIAIIGQAEQLADRLRALEERPAGSDEVVAQALSHVWQTVLGNAPLTGASTYWRKQQFAQHVEAAVGGLYSLLEHVRRSRLELAARGVGGLLRRSDFDALHVIQGAALAWVDLLPEGHPAAGLVEPESLYRMNGSGYVVLGHERADGWEVAQVVELTHRWRAEQIEEERRRKEEMVRRAEVEARIAESMRDPLAVEVAQLRAEVADLKARQVEALAESAEVVVVE